MGLLLNGDGDGQVPFGREAVDPAVQLVDEIQVPVQDVQGKARAVGQRGLRIVYRIPTVNAVVVHSVDVVDAPVAAVHRNAAVCKVAIGIPNRGGLLRNDVRAVFFLRLDVIEELGESLGACGEVGIQDAAVHSLSREILIELIDHIKVYENGNISVKFKFADELRKIAEYIEINTTEDTAVAG